VSLGSVQLDRLKDRRIVVLWLVDPRLPTSFVNGDMSLDWCGSERNEDGPSHPMGLGCVAGISDSLNVNRVENDFTSCTSADVTTGQAADVVLKYLSEHPETRRLPAAVLVTSAVSETFCPPLQPLPEVKYEDH